MQYKGAILNSSAQVDLSGVVLAGDLAEVGGLVGLNNRGLVASCWSDSNVYGSGSRENGNEGMAVVSNLVACNAGALVNCYASGDVTTKEHSTYAGMVSGWVTGIGKSYHCWYDLDSTMIAGRDTDNPLIVKPVESIGTKVSSGVNDEGDAYTGGLVDKMTGYSASSYTAVAEGLNGSFAAFPIDITVFGLANTALKTWTYDADSGLVTFGAENGTVTYVQPDCEKVEKPEQKLQDGTWYGRTRRRPPWSGSPLRTTPSPRPRSSPAPSPAKPMTPLWKRPGTRPPTVTSPTMRQPTPAGSPAAPARRPIPTASPMKSSSATSPTPSTRTWTGAACTSARPPTSP